MTSDLINDIQRKRERQIMLGLTPAHDDQFPRGELGLAAMAYATYDPTVGVPDAAEVLWPFPKAPFLPHDERRENLIEAIAYLVAEVERGDRAES